MIEYSSLELRMPMISVDYEVGVKYTYSRGKGHENLKRELLKACDGYCMYCYAKVQVDGKDCFHLEHAIEKDLSNTNKLHNCVPNIGLACPKCNDSFKKSGQPTREDVGDKVLADFEAETCDDPAHCHTPCQAYIDIRKKYIAHRQMVLQPPLADGTEQEFGLTYNVLKGCFQPSSSNEAAKDIVWSHICKFNLNDETFKTRALHKYCKDVVETRFVQRCKGRYENRVVDVFIDYMAGCCDADVIKLCEIICALNDISPQGGRLS